MGLPSWTLAKPVPKSVRATAKAEAKRNRLRPRIILAVTHVESRFNPKASNGPCKGLMQVDVRAWKVPRNDWYSVKGNMRWGSRILASMIRKYGVEGGLHAYNVGEGAYLRGVRNYRYVRKVLAARRSYR